MSNLVLFQMTGRFAADRLVLNLDKTNTIKLITNNLQYSTLNIFLQIKVYRSNSKYKIAWFTIR